MKRPGNLSTAARWIVAMCALALVATFFLPFWFIFLTAPQYPEGLTMYIWLDHLSGEVTIINGLNHYIGMRPIHESQFPEFGYMRWIMVALIVLGIVVAIRGRRSWLLGYLLLLAAAGALALYDFYQWSYAYGHELDPHAPIKVPGLTYQPPLVGHKKLLNFDAYSYPDSGGWVMIAAVGVMVLVLLWDLFRRKRKTV